MRFFALVTLCLALLSRVAYAKPQIYVAALPDECNRQTLLAGATSKGGWDWQDTAEAPLVLRVVRDGDLFVATFYSVRGERRLQETDCETLLFAAAAIAPLLWDDVEPTLSFGAKNNEKPPLPTLQRQPAVWVATSTGQIGTGDLPGMSLGAGLEVAYRKRSWQMQLGLEYSQAETSIVSPNATIEFAKFVVRPGPCLLAGARWQVHGCAGVAVGVLRATPSGQAISESKSSLYLGIGGSMGALLRLTQHYQIGIALVGEQPILRRTYVFSPTPTVATMGGFAFNAVFSLSYIFSDRS